MYQSYFMMLKSEDCLLNLLSVKKIKAEGGNDDQNLQGE